MKRANSFKHGMIKTRLYRIWKHIKERMLSPSCSRYYRYGGRGLLLYEEWKEFIPFMTWALSSGYRNELTIDRINNDLGYFPENCRWITKSLNSKNKSHNDMTWIYKNGSGFIVKRTIDYKTSSYGTYYIIEEAKQVRDALYAKEIDK